MNRILSVVRSMTDKIIELSRGVVTAPFYGETDDSLTAFVRTLLGRPPRGRDIRSFKDQLTALSAAQIRLAMTLDDCKPLQVRNNGITL